MDTIHLSTPQIVLHTSLTTKSSPPQNKALKKLLSKALPALARFLFQGGDFARLDARGVQRAALCVHLCGLKKVTSLNKTRRSRDGATDVLSFPVHDSLRNHQEPLPPIVDLGDIFICVPIAARQAADFGISLEEEILHLLIHGFLHLVGYDHEVSAEEERKMFRLEERLIEEIANDDR